MAGTSPIDVNANQTNPNTFNTGGVAEFEIANPVVALTGSGTADAPFLLIYLNTVGVTNINVSFNLRDVDGSIDNAVQPVALQYRVGTSGNFINIPAGYVADASTGPSLATEVTPVNVTLPAGAHNQSQVQLRIITTNAVGNDEWIGVDDISITGTPGGGEPTTTVTLQATDANAAEAGQEPGTFRITRTGDTSAPLSVNYTVATGTGQATNGTDYTPNLTGIATIDAGQSFVDLAIAPVDDSAVEGNETITLNLVDTSDYDLGGSSTGTVTIADNDVPLTRIRDIQGTDHISPLLTSATDRVGVFNVAGIVTAKASNGFYLQDPTPDADAATSEGIFVFTGTSSAGSAILNSVSLGSAVLVTGTVSEFRPGANNLTTTQISNTSTQALSVTPWTTAPTTTITPISVNPPTLVINNDFSTANPGNVETGGDFEPATEGIDYYESLEGMLVQVNNPVAVSPTNNFGEIWVLDDNGADATGRTARGGSLISPNDFNPERIQIDDDLIRPGSSSPLVDVGAQLDTVTGVISYNFNNYEVLATSPITVDTPSPLEKEVTTLNPVDDKLTVATFNVENLDPGDGATQFNALAQRIVTNLQSPDIITLEEIQDNNGPTNDSVVDAAITYNTLIAAIQAAGGPTYEFRQINPTDDQDGGEPGGNIRVGFLFKPERVTYVDRPGGTATTQTTVNNVGGDPAAFLQSGSDR
ncbi:Calx-beta domain-containing protein [Microcoleus vaginatus]|uniref:Calx-beta domain-containing protein n=1 Tax=Microcoleus vaginatus TaxID=119532 RepID=UPI00403F1A6C